MASARSKLHKREELVTPVIFDNTMPPPPVEAKLMSYPFDEDVVFGYDMLQGVSSEVGFVHQLHAEPGLGVPFNLIDPAQMFTLPKGSRPPLDPADALICSEEFARPASRRNDAITSEPLVDWMFRASHIHLDLYDSVYKHADQMQLAQARATQRAAAAKAMLSRGGMSRAARIDDSFAAVSGEDAAPVHPTNRALQPRRVWDVLPAPQGLWAGNHVLVAFDADPDVAPAGSSAAAAAGPAAASVDSSGAGSTFAAAANSAGAAFGAGAGAGAGSGPGSAAAAGARSKRKRLEGALLRTPAVSRPANVAEGTVRVNYHLPETAADADALAAGTGAAAAAGSGSSSSSTSGSAAPAASAASASALRGVRTYHMVVERADARAGDEQFLLLWDDAGAAVHLVPVRARAQLTRIAAGTSGVAGDAGFDDDAGRLKAAPSRVLVARRPPLPEEEEAALEAAATQAAPERARSLRSDAAARRQARLDAAAAAAQAKAAAVAAAAAAAASLSSPSASAGGAGGGGGSSLAPGSSAGTGGHAGPGGAAAAAGAAGGAAAAAPSAGDGDADSDFDQE